MINYKSIILFSITLFFVIISSSLIADDHKDHKKRDKNMTKMTKITIKIDRIFMKLYALFHLYSRLIMTKNNSGNLLKQFNPQF